MDGKTWRQCKIRMSKNKMADLLYAVIMCDAKITSTFSLGKGFSRSQNAYNNADLMIKLDETHIKKFEDMAGIRLELPQKVNIN